MLRQMGGIDILNSVTSTHIDNFAPMEHVLDNPVWNALMSGNKQLDRGNDQVKYFDTEVSPFVGLKENSADNFRLLYDLVPDKRFCLFVAPVQVEIPAYWKVLVSIPGLQMVHDKNSPLDEVGEKLVLLTDEHIPQMLALTKLTDPGPFAERTIEFGHYMGVFDGDKLVAMAGQRMHAFNYAEISAVCTHPDHTGKGYARQLLLHHIHRIKAASNMPYLHVRHDNERAIKVYERLGFSTRTEVYFYALMKNDI
ncbi:MAG: GNAT family N-acetyltransferase [Mucilaginibacter sp.]